jgi:hypothetical protein
MSTNKTNLSVNNLDFDTIRNNLRSYLESQDEFKDYNFDGSAMSILLDVLAYNTHYEAFYNNMVANEMFLDSAAKRDSVVSLAKHLGYTPSSTTSAQATIDIVLGSTAGLDANSIIPIGSKFTASKDNVSYTFINQSVGSIDPTAETHVQDLVVTEGRRAKISFVYNSSDEGQKFIIPDKNVDTSTIRVRVQTSPSDNTGFADSWNLASTILDVTATSKVYFLQEVNESKYEVYFGDDVVGKKLTDGNLVSIEYITSSGSVANDIGTTDAAGSRSFSYGSGNTVIVKSASSGGAARESIASIKNRAPKSYQAQDRAVTTEDYKAILKNDYPDMESINVWGGEDNIPPEYGTVFISFKPASGTVVTKQTKESIKNSLVNSKSVLSITPKIVEPEFIYLNVNVVLNYDSDKTLLGQESLKTLVKNTITKFASNNLEKFDKGLRYSKFLKEIDDTEGSIVSNETSIKLEKRLFPNIGKKDSYAINFGNSISRPHVGHQPVIESSLFRHLDSNNVLRECRLDDKDGKVRVYYESDGLKTYINESAGTVNYEDGIVLLNGLTIQSIVSDNFIKVMATPAGQDISSARNTILVIDQTDSDAIKITTDTVLGNQYR